jgi:cell division protein FtsA
MEQHNNIITAIDIGTTKIVTIVGRKNDTGNLEILGMSKAQSKGIVRGSVINIEEAVNTIRCTIEDVQKQVGFPIREAYVGIAGQHITSITGRGYILRDTYEKEITKEDTEKLLAEMYKTAIQPGEEIIHIIPQNYLVDNEHIITNPVGMFGKRLEGNYLIVIGQTLSARMIKLAVERLGIKVKQLILEPLASSAAVLTTEQIEAGVVMVDIGGGTTDIAVYRKNVIRGTAVIPFGGNVITKDIEEGLSLINKYAELLKTQYGSALSDLADESKVITIPGINGGSSKEVSLKSLAAIIQSRMDEIIDGIIYHIGDADDKDKLIAGIVITGGGAMLKNLKQLLSYRTELEVHIGKPNIQIASVDLKEINQPMYSTSVGLLIKGFEYEEMSRKQEEETIESSPVQKKKILKSDSDSTSQADDKSDSTRSSNPFNKAITILNGVLVNMFNDDTDKQTFNDITDHKENNKKQ